MVVDVQESAVVWGVETQAAGRAFYTEFYTDYAS